MNYNKCRLWGNHGQVDLEKARICLINANAAGTETLKSMVLPGRTRIYQLFTYIFAFNLFNQFHYFIIHLIKALVISAS